MVKQQQTLANSVLWKYFNFGHVPFLCDNVFEYFFSPLVPQCLRFLSLSALHTKWRWVATSTICLQMVYFRLHQLDKSLMFEVADLCSMTDVPITCKWLEMLSRLHQPADELPWTDEVKALRIRLALAILIYYYSWTETTVQHQN